MGEDPARQPGPRQVRRWRNQSRAEDRNEVQIHPRPFEALWVTGKDTDGFLSKEEFIPHIADKADAPARFVRFDPDKDGRRSKEEFVKAGN